MPGLTQSVNGLVNGLNKINGEISQLKSLRAAPNDQFVRVMQVFM